MKKFGMNSDKFRDKMIQLAKSTDLFEFTDEEKKELKSKYNGPKKIRERITEKAAENIAQGKSIRPEYLGEAAEIETATHNYEDLVAKMSEIRLQMNKLRDDLANVNADPFSNVAQMFSALRDMLKDAKLGEFMASLD